MKRFALILLALVMTVLCASCGQTDTAETSAGQPETAAQWVDLLAQELSFDDTMTLVSENAASVYGIQDEDGYTGDCALYISTMATPEEIAVFRADSVLSSADLTVLAAARLMRQKESYADYAPGEVPKLESAVVRTIGDFVIVCVCADNAKAETLLDAYA